MDLHFCFLLFLSTLTAVAASTYHPVSFLSRPQIRADFRHTSYSSFTIHNNDKPPQISRRSYGAPPNKPFIHNAPHVGLRNEVWKNGIYVATSPINGATVEIGRGGHLTPDFSNGLDYPDPFLISGITAQAVAKLLYSHEMFFSDYPHVSSLLRNQQERRDNGLEGHRLGSIRLESPFHPYRFRYIYSR